jgi:hypothetical protein
LASESPTLDCIRDIVCHRDRVEHRISLTVPVLAARQAHGPDATIAVRCGRPVPEATWQFLLGAPFERRAAELGSVPSDAPCQRTARLHTDRLRGRAKGSAMPGRKFLWQPAVAFSASHISAILVVVFYLKEESGVTRLASGWTRWRASLRWYLLAFSPMSVASSDGCC